MGRNKSAKGGLLMGLRRLLYQDGYLQDRLTRKGVQLEVGSLLFGHCAVASQLPKDLYPELGLVDPELNPATYSAKDESSISKLQWRLFQKMLPEGVENAEQLSNALQHQRKAMVWLVEASTPFVYPVSFAPPVEVAGGHDLGISTLCNLALDKRTRPHTFLFAVDADPRLKDDADSNQFRERSFLSDPDPDKLYGGETQVITTVNDKEVNVKELPADQQLGISRLLKISMASKAAIIAQHERKDGLNRQLFEQGLISEPNDTGFYELFSPLCLPRGWLIIPTNNWFGGQKDYDLGYLLSSYVLRRYPEILR